MALAFVTLPFVVRAVQPVLIEADREVEEAAASLGASNWTIFRRVLLPTLAPAILSGGGLAFARAIGEYGSVVLIGGNIPGVTQVASQYIQQQIEIDRPAQRRRGVGGAAARRLPRAARCSASSRERSSVARRRRREARHRRPADRADHRPGYLGVLVVLPVAVILWRSFGEGIGAFVASVTTPAAISAFNLSVLIVAIVVPVNVVFGITVALALVRGRFPGRAPCRPSSTCPSRSRPSSSASP